MGLKITILLPNKNMGGGTQMVAEYANRLAERNHDIKVITPIVPPRLLDLIIETGPISFVKKAAELASASGDDSEFRTEDVTTVGYQRAFRSQLLDVVPDGDIVLAPNWSTALVLPELPESKGVPVHLVQGYEAWGVWNEEQTWREAQSVAGSDESPTVYMPQTTPVRLQSKLRKRQVDEALNLPIKRIAVSEWVKALLRKGVRTSVHGVIHNGINTDVYCPGDENKTGDKTVLLSQSRSQPFKGTERVIEVFGRLRQEFDDLRFVMFGRDSKSIPDWIEFKGWIYDNSHLSNMYKRSDIFVSASESEGWGLPSHEAAGCGTATVATNVGWRYNLTANAVATVPVRDTEAILRETRRLIESPRERQSLGRNGSEYVQNNLDIESAVNTLEQVLTEIAVERNN